MDVCLLIPQWSIRPTARIEFEALIQRWRETVLAMPGCLAFKLFRGFDDPLDYLFLETWVDEASFRAYVTSPEAADFLREASYYASSPGSAQLAKLVHERSVL